MATKINGGGVVSMADEKKKRGRPSKQQIEERKASEAREQARADGKIPPAGSETTAPGFGHNRMSEGLFLHHVNAIRSQDSVIDQLLAGVKAARGKRKDLRNTARGDGMGLKELDEALEALEVERVDLLAREERRTAYFEFLGLPTLRSADTKKIEETDAARWYNRGNIAGRLAEDRAIPEGCPPEHNQDWLKGWDHGQQALMRESPLTRGAFTDEKVGSAAAAASEPPAGMSAPDAPAPFADFLALKEEHFATGTALEDCNFKTLLDGMEQRWRAASNVVVVVGGKKRILKEPASGAEPAYEDTGKPSDPLSDVEDATPADLEAAGLSEELGAVAEAEPEIVAGVVADASGLTEEGETPIENDDAEPDAEAAKIAADKAEDAAKFD